MSCRLATRPCPESVGVATCVNLVTILRPTCRISLAASRAAASVWQLSRPPVAVVGVPSGSSGTSSTVATGSARTDDEEEQNHARQQQLTAGNHYNQSLQGFFSAQSLQVPASLAALSVRSVFNSGLGLFLGNVRIKDYPYYFSFSLLVPCR